MITVQPTGREDLLEIRFEGTISREDYEATLIPAIDAAIEASDRARLLVVMDSGFSDFTLGAMWDDSRMGLKHWRGFDRVAMVSGSAGMRRTVQALSVAFPCPVMVFEPGQEDEARLWLRESLGSIHQTDLGDGVLHLAFLGKLEAAAYETEAQDMNAFIRRNDRFRLLLDLRDFDGWQGLGAIGEHLRIVRDHVALLDKAAIVGDAGWQKMAVTVGRRFLGKEAQFFEGDRFDAAVAWLKES